MAEVEKKWCAGCETEHLLNEFALSNGKVRRSCKSFNNQREAAHKKAPAIKEKWLNNLINGVWRCKSR